MLSVELVSDNYVTLYSCSCNNKPCIHRVALYTHVTICITLLKGGVMDSELNTLRVMSISGIGFQFCLLVIIETWTFPFVYMCEWDF